MVVKPFTYTPFSGFYFNYKACFLDLTTNKSLIYYLYIYK